MAVRWRGEGSQHQGARPYQEDSWKLVHAWLTARCWRSWPMAWAAMPAAPLRASSPSMPSSMRSSKAAAWPTACRMPTKRCGSAPRASPISPAWAPRVVAALVRGDEVRWISVGDSPFYLVTAGKLEQLNADHSMAPQIDALVARGMLTAEEAEHHPGRHTLREAVMGEPLSLIDKGSRRLGPGDKLLLCSDGVQSLDERTDRGGSVASRRAAWSRRCWPSPRTIRTTSRSSSWSAAREQECRRHRGHARSRGRKPARGHRRRREGRRHGRGLVGRHRRADPAALGQQADPGHGLRRERCGRALRARQRAHRALLRLAQRRDAPRRDGAGLAEEGRPGRGRPRMRHACAAPAADRRGAGTRECGADGCLQQLLGQAQRLPDHGGAVRRADQGLHQVRPSGAAPPARRS